MNNEDLLQESFLILKKSQDRISLLEKYIKALELKSNLTDDLVVELKEQNTNLRDRISQLESGIYQTLTKIGKN